MLQGNSVAVGGLVTLWIPLLLGVITTANAADDYKKWKCKGEKRVLRVPKSCEDEFSVYARELDIGVGATVGAKGTVGADLSADQQIVQLQLDALNKDLRTHYVALCMGWTSPDPCDPKAIERYETGRQALAEQAGRLRSAVTAAGTDDKGVSALAAALADASAADADLLERLEALSERIAARDNPIPTPSPEPPSGGIAGRWDARLDHADGQFCGPSPLHVEMLVRQGANDWQGNVTLLEHDGASQTLEMVADGAGMKATDTSNGPYHRLVLHLEGEALSGRVERFHGGMTGCMGTYSVRATRIP